MAKKKLGRMSTKVKHSRRGDKMYIVTNTVTVTDAIVDFNDIVKACEVVADDHHRDPPWENCDGYDHELVNVDDMPQHYNPVYVTHNRAGGKLIVIDEERWAEVCGNFQYLHARGYAKQVAHQMVAKLLRQTYEQLIKWYNDGWEYWGVTCDYLDATSSMWGIDDYDYAHDDVRVEMAQDVACQLKKLGYDIINTIDYTAPVVTQARLRHQIAHNLGFKNPQEYRAWLEK